MFKLIGRGGVLAGSLLVLGCAGTSGERASADGPRRDILTHEQLVEASSQNAYEAVKALRSNWLYPRGVDSLRSPGEVLVYFQDMRLGGVEALRGISTREVGYVQYFNANEATARWGLDHGHGVIYVSALPRR